MTISHVRKFDKPYFHNGSRGRSGEQRLHIFANVHIPECLFRQFLRLGMNLGVGVMAFDIGDARSAVRGNVVDGDLTQF